MMEGMDLGSAGSTQARGLDTGEDLPMEVVLGSGSLIHQVSRELRTALDARLAPLGITAQQAALLLRSSRQETSPNQLAQLLGTDTAGMTRLLDRLEGKGLIRRQRHPDDRRSIVIELTGEGRALLPRLGPVFGRITRQLLAGFSAADVRQVSQMLQRMLGNLREGPSAPG